MSTAEATAMESVEEVSSEQVTCQLCGESVHAVHIHIKKSHEDLVLSKGSLEAAMQFYQSEYPLAPLFSEKALEAKKKHAEKLKKQKEIEANEAGGQLNKITLKDMWNIRDTRETRNAKNEPIEATMINYEGEYDYFIPDVDTEYVANLNDVKIALLGFERNLPTYLWGHAGVGKSTLPEQIAARTNRPMIRVQHTGSTEESHILGQMAANEKGTYFVPGPLAIAMRFGLTYLADEYDFAFPQVLAVYQPVLEGKPLYIKEADEEWKRVVPHKNFRFLATGNTNGSGDATGLFQGTTVQNAANYERFAIVHKLEYMSEKNELAIVMKKTGLTREYAQKVIKFGTLCRKAYQDAKITNTLGPRVLIHIAEMWKYRADPYSAVALSFSNRLPESCKVVVDGIAQRIFGDE
jgi:cobaltochelatase CobS